MDKKSAEELEAQLLELLEKKPLPVKDLALTVAEAPTGKVKSGMVATALSHFEKENDFNGAFEFVEAAQATIAEALEKSACATVHDLFRKLAKDRQLLSFIDGVDWEKRPLREYVGRVGRLISFAKGSLVISRAWGLGTVRDVDSFYRRLVVDFKNRMGHQFNYDAACETLVLAPENHILVTQKADPARVEQMLKEQPADFVKAMLLSFGDMPITRLEELCAQYGFVKTANWKKFWERARTDLRKDKCVEIPTRRAEPLHIKAKEEDYGEGWYGAFSQIRDPKSILSCVREFESQARAKDLDDDHRLKLAERLAFALKAARGVDDALFAQIAFCIAELKLDALLAANEKLAFAISEKSRTYLWGELLSGEHRYLDAGRKLPARDTGKLVQFMTGSEDETLRNEAKSKLFAELPKMCFALLTETLDAFKKDEGCEAAVAELLHTAKAPATLVTLILGRFKEFQHWTKLPPLVVVLMHAVVIGEGKQGGETLRMQNMIRRLFADQKWMDGILDQLQPADRALFFERFQASIAWDPSTHHLIVTRMVRHAPELANRVSKKVEAKKLERITSLRSYAERQAAYEKLTKVEIPENTKRIEFAKSYGDLSENAEYQYAKDEQRALMQKESLLQKDLNEVKAVDFADVVEPTKVVPGSSVTIVTAAGEEKVFIVLGEWDNDLDRGIISNKTKLAESMLDKQAGDTFELSDAEGNISMATIKSVGALSEEIRTWIKTVPTVA